MHVTYLPMSWKSGDNYCYLLTDEESNQSWLIDPAYPSDILDFLTKKNKTEVASIVNTHHHYDHAGGNGQLLSTLYKSVPVIAGKDCPYVSYTPSDEEVILLGKNVEITALHTPCHTQDSICYYAKDKKTGEKCVFTGDTLFTAGCGRFFEGTAEQMKSSLEKLLSLPEETVTYPGHEYTASDAKFAKTVFGSNNQALNELEEFAKKHEFTTGCFTLKDEKAFNPFVRLTDPFVVRATGKKDPVEAMGKLRAMKDIF
ncbi:DEKNAAC100458 [Brettanomyces naardenensis]|uniref:hydroxyacylglutathione hydrolase n=1 Tax=Brettanomyces naardenensis TaxID=13370 RepID=A0A448YG94_BRENA|nr:DEKNAAC100458 [Brettanomyces naardenensis]